VSFGFNLIPFAGPSNAFIAAYAAIIVGLGSTDTASLLVIGIIVAVGATLAKGVHYGTIFFIGKQLSEKTPLEKNRNNAEVKKETSPSSFWIRIHWLRSFWIRVRTWIRGKYKGSKVETNTAKVKKWAFPLLFLAAATPIPDEPIVFTLGLMKYSITKFFVSFFLGKLTITVMGAFVGNTVSHMTMQWFSEDMMLILMTLMSIALTIIMVVIMFKVDLDKLTYRLIGKKSNHNAEEEKVGKN